MHFSLQKKTCTCAVLSLPDRKTSLTARQLLRTFSNRFSLLCSCLRFSSCVGGASRHSKCAAWYLWVYKLVWFFSWEVVYIVRPQAAGERYMGVTFMR